MESQFEEDTEAEIAALNAAAAAAMGGGAAGGVRELMTRVSCTVIYTCSEVLIDSHHTIARIAQFEDPAKAVDMRVVKKKSFEMPPMSVQDAIVCLD